MVVFQNWRVCFMFNMLVLMLLPNIPPSETFFSCSSYLYRAGKDKHRLYSGWYTLDVGGEEQRVYCNMDILGGGWMLILRSSGRTPTPWNRTNVMSLCENQFHQAEDFSILKKADFIIQNNNLNGIELLLTTSFKGLVPDKSNYIRWKYTRANSTLVSETDDQITELVDFRGNVFSIFTVPDFFRVPWIPSDGSYSDVFLTLSESEKLKNGIKTGNLLAASPDGPLANQPFLYFIRERLEGLSVEVHGVGQYQLSNAWFHPANIILIDGKRIFKGINNHFCGVAVAVVNLFTHQIPNKWLLSCDSKNSTVDLFSHIPEDGSHALLIGSYRQNKWDNNILHQLRTRLSVLNPEFIKIKTLNKGSVAAILLLAQNVQRVWWEKVELRQDENVSTIHRYLECTSDPMGKGWSPWSSWSSCMRLPDQQLRTRRVHQCCPIVPIEGECVNHSTELRACAEEFSSCPALQEDYIWPMTIQGETAEFPCKAGRRGQVKRRCTNNGTWELPDFSGCVQDKLYNLSNIVENMSSIPENVQHAVDTFTKTVDNVETRADLVVVSQMFKTLVEKGDVGGILSTSETRDVFIQNMLVAVDSVLSVKNNKTLTSNLKEVACFVLSTELLAVKSLRSLAENEPSSITYKGNYSEMHLRKLSVIHSEGLEYKSQGAAISLSSNSLAALVSSRHNVSEVRVVICITGVGFVEPTLRDVVFPLNTIVSVAFEPYPQRTKNFTCVYFNTHETNNVWGTEGCALVFKNKSTVICRCNHTTSYAVLMQVVSYKPVVEHFTALKYLSYLGLALSITSLLLMLIILLYLRTLQTVRIKIHKCLAVCLLAAQVIFVSGITSTGEKVMCKVIAFLMHYLFLSVFTWMLCEGLNLFILISYPTSHVEFPPFTIIGFVLPLIVVAITGGIKYNDYISSTSCWLNVEDGVIFAFVGPAILIILVNIIILGIVLHVFLRVKKNVEKCLKEKIRSGLRAGFVLLPLLGITWMFGILTMDHSTLFFTYLFCLINSIQGVGLFIFHIILNDEVKVALRSKLNSTPGEPRICKESGLTIWVEFVSKVTGFSSIRKKNKVHPVTEYI
ncbi:adhesion G protein-coupled receptor L3-like isoform X2 [Tachypleus tridentatus]|uniref:adhesion G protein-coupled receptor L3-like isoform X2 n=1 Tax=Tachypleus tridentatus TaxID=6853 RepID=UPI003FD479CD